VAIQDIQQQTKQQQQQPEASQQRNFGSRPDIQPFRNHSGLLGKVDLANAAFLR